MIKALLLGLFLLAPQPTVNAGPDQVVTSPVVRLRGAVPPTWTSLWTVAVGKQVIIEEPKNPTTDVMFLEDGAYVLILVASDGRHLLSDAVEITVKRP